MSICLSAHCWKSDIKILSFTWKMQNKINAFLLTFFFLNTEHWRCHVSRVAVHKVTQMHRVIPPLSSILKMEFGFFLVMIFETKRHASRTWVRHVKVTRVSAAATWPAKKRTRAVKMSRIMPETPCVRGRWPIRSSKVKIFDCVLKKKKKKWVSHFPRCWVTWGQPGPPSTWWEC